MSRIKIELHTRAVMFVRSDSVEKIPKGLKKFRNMKVNYTSFKVYLNHIYPNTKHPSVRPTIHPSIQFLCFLYFNLSIFKTDSFRPTQPSLKHNTHLSDHSPTGPPIHQCIIRTSFIHCRCSQNHIPTNPSVHFLQDTKYRCSETL